MIKNQIRTLKKKFDKLGIDGYLVPKNDEFFTEYAENDRLKFISNFDGSAGLAIILKRSNFLFVDGRYTLQATNQSGKKFKIIETGINFPKKIFKNLFLGFDPKLFTKDQLNRYFDNKTKLLPINNNLIDELKKFRSIKKKPFFSLPDNVVGESSSSKIKKIKNFLNTNKSDYLFISAPENVAWLLNIRGYDSPHSPIPNCRLIIDKRGNLFFICEKAKSIKITKQKKINRSQLIEPNNFKKLINKLNMRYFIIDKKTCSYFHETIIRSKFKVLNKEDPCYYLKSIKNLTEIDYMTKAHINDGLALTKFLYWLKIENKKKITEIDAQKKLEKFRKLNNDYLFPSFNTIAGTASNGAIVHYRATKKTNRLIKKNDIFLCDSGGQYKYGTTDVTRTICFKKPKNRIKNIFTKVLKGHIAVVLTNLQKQNTGNKIDIRARKFLKEDGLDYAHGTGHGVGFFLNVHEGPQAISKYNKIKFKKGMIISNEPGYYKKNSFGIRIENLIYVKKIKKSLVFENLTLVPIEKDLINFKLLTKNEKDYLFKYHLKIYSKYSKFLNLKQRKWLASLI